MNNPTATNRDPVSSSQMALEQLAVDEFGFKQPTGTKNTKVKRRSIPFDEEKDLDPFLLFPELHMPYSPLRNDSARYQREMQEALQAKARTRGSPVKVQGLINLIHQTYDMGEYALTKQEASETTFVSQTDSQSDVWDPMDLD